MDRFTKVMEVKDLNNGAINDLFVPELKKVLDNIADENTNWKPVREIVIKVKIRPLNEKRNNASSIIEVYSKLAPQKPHESLVVLETDGRDITMLATQEPEQLELANIVEMDREKKAW